MMMINDGIMEICKRTCQSPAMRDLELRPCLIYGRPVIRMHHVRNILTTMMWQWHCTLDLRPALTTVLPAWMAPDQGYKLTDPYFMVTTTTWVSLIIIIFSTNRAPRISLRREWGGCYLKASIGFPLRHRFWSGLHNSPVMFVARLSTVTTTYRCVIRAPLLEIEIALWIF